MTAKEFALMILALPEEQQDLEIFQYDNDNDFQHLVKVSQQTLYEVQRHYEYEYINFRPRTPHRVIKALCVEPKTYKVGE